MSIILTYKTDLKDLKFGNDRPQGGSSQQPYVKTAIPPQNQDYAETMSILGTPIGTGTDALIRGGISSGEHVAKDLERIGKWFFDINSPKGLQFVAKQGILSEISVRTQASQGAKPNQGFYSPLQTLYQIGTNNIGGHSNRFLKGLLNPLKQTRGYLDSIESSWSSDVTENFVQKIIIGGEKGDNNRLVLLAGSKITNSISASPSTGISVLPSQLMEYQGGPNSILGAGKTNILFATNNVGAPLRTGINNAKIKPYVTTDKPLRNANLPIIGVDGISLADNQIKKDFRKDGLKDQKSSVIMGLAPNYSQTSGGKNYTIEGKSDSRIHYKSPGQTGNVIDYTFGKTNSNGDPIGAVDLINAQPIYKSGGVRDDEGVKKNDLVKFRIAAIDTTDPSQKEFIHFRAFIDNFSDNYTGNWTPTSYMGRGEDFYRYSKFQRSIQVDYTIAAQSKPEIMEQYRKLNFLVSNTFPDYTNKGYMAGPLIALTLGGWCYELPGFINTISLSIPQESPWEIGIDTYGKFDRSVKEMPHMCKVSMQFTPIHTFRPSKQKNTFTVDGNEIDVYGDQRYIQLKAVGNNYDKDSINPEKFDTSDRFYQPEPRFNLKQPTTTATDEVNINTLDGVQPNNLV